jgi:hypothetical protein
VTDWIATKQCLDIFILHIILILLRQPWNIICPPTYFAFALYKQPHLNNSNILQCSEQIWTHCFPAGRKIQCRNLGKTDYLILPRKEEYFPSRIWKQLFKIKVWMPNCATPIFSAANIPAGKKIIFCFYSFVAANSAEKKISPPYLCTIGCVHVPM